MSVSGEATDPNEGSTDGGDDSPPELEGDVPKPAFELPDKSEEPTPVEPKVSAKERHRQRGADFGSMRRELESARSERQRMAEQLAELRGRIEARSAPAPAAKDAVSDQLKENRRAIENALERMGKGDTNAIEEWHAAREREQRLISRSEAQAIADEAAKNAPKPLDPVLAAVAAKYDWIQTDPEARQVAEGYVARLVRQEKRDLSNPAVRKQTLMQAAAEAARDLGLGGEADEPGEAQRERYRGIAGQSSGAGRSGKTVVSLNGEQKAQAEALFRHLEPEAAHREWWAKIGTRITNK